jgi:hypothetical protein
MKLLLTGILLFLLTSATICAQSPLAKTISVEIEKQRLDNVLEILSNKGDFYFSYNSTSLKRDSLISLKVRNKTVKEILNQLFTTDYEFKESGNYIIIRKAPVRMVMITNKATLEEKIYAVSGFVYDEQSGYAIHDASVYEKKLLAATLTDAQGFFKIRLKSGKSSTAALTVSKEFYEDTTVLIEPRHSQQLTITLLPFEREQDRVLVKPEDYLLADSIIVPVNTIDTTVNNSTINTVGPVEKTGVGKVLLSARQKMQSINLKRFFTSRPFQVSLTPGLSSHGKLSPQVVNNFSLNLFGGYTAGTNGLEIGGLFNIDKKEVKYMQVAGLFNLVGGEVKGLQVAGINNLVLDTVKGMQVAGVSNLVKGKFSGLQMAGVYNHVTDSSKGVQIAGVGNFSQKKLSGVQIAGVVNFSNKETAGAQVAGVINYTKHLKGVQIGLINIADTSDGYAIGLINIVLKGYHKLSVYANELTNVNVAFKTGSRRFYNILQAGFNTGITNKIFSFGYGFGTELSMNKKKTFSLNPEVTVQHLYLGTWEYSNILTRLQLNLNYKFNKYFSLFAGPSFAIYNAGQLTAISGYRNPLSPAEYTTMQIGNKATGWFGWTAGINFF